MKDAIIRAPAAEWYAGKNATQIEVKAALEPPSPQEIIQAQDVEIRRLRSGIHQIQVTAGTIANAAVALTHMLREANGRSPEIRISRDLQRRLDGAQIKVRTDADGDIYVSYVDGTEPIWDGTPDG